LFAHSFASWGTGRVVAYNENIEIVTVEDEDDGTTWRGLADHTEPVEDKENPHSSIHGPHDRLSALRTSARCRRKRNSNAANLIDAYDPRHPDHDVIMNFECDTGLDIALLPGFEVTIAIVDNPLTIV
jgi:hypothetical protein